MNIIRSDQIISFKLLTSKNSKFRPKQLTNVFYMNFYFLPPYLRTICIRSSSEKFLFYLTNRIFDNYKHGIEEEIKISLKAGND